MCAGTMNGRLIISALKEPGAEEYRSRAVLGSRTPLRSRKEAGLIQSDFEGATTPSQNLELLVHRFAANVRTKRHAKRGDQLPHYPFRSAPVVSGFPPGRLLHQQVSQPRGVDSGATIGRHFFCIAIRPAASSAT